MLFDKQKQETSSQKTKKDLRFTDIDEPLRNYFIKTFLFLFVGIFILLFCAIIFGHFTTMAMLLTFILFYGLYILFLIYQCLNNKVFMYTGECQTIHKKVVKNPFDTNYLLIQLEDSSLVRISISNKTLMNVTEGDIIRCYSTCKELPQLNNGTYYIPNIIFVCPIERKKNTNWMKK